MVGEIRDAETAQIAVQAALTGHQVFATVHANNVFDVIGRLSTMGVDPYNLVSALNGVVAQRLVRIICPHCSTPDEPGAERIEASALPDIPLGWNFRRGIGCAHCRGTGYKGRRAIAQTLAMDVGLRSLIAERASPAALREAARGNTWGAMDDAAALARLPPADAAELREGIARLLALDAEIRSHTDPFLSSVRKLLSAGRQERALRDAYGASSR